MSNTGVDDVVNLVDLDFDIVYNLSDLGLGSNPGLGLKNSLDFFGKLTLVR